MSLLTLQTWLFRLFVVSIALSFQPVLNLGSSNGLNIEISAVQIVGGLFVVAMVPIIWAQRAAIMKHRAFLLLGLIAFLAVASIALSGAPSRSISIAAYTVFLVSLVTGCAVYIAGSEVSRRTDAMKALVLASGFSALVGLGQFIGDGLGVVRSTTRLLPEYTSTVFGFARPQAFMAEPQYLAGLLVLGLAATMILQQIKPTKPSWLTSGLLWLVLWLTLSRGGFIAVGVAVVAVALTGRHHKKLLRIAKQQLQIAVVSFILALGLVGWAGQQYANDNQDFTQSVQRYIEHASLSVIDFPDPEIKKTPSTTVAPAAAEQQEAAQTTQKTISSTVKDTAGEIEASRVGRLEAVKLAVAVATKSPRNFLVGVGVGGFGTAASQIDSAYDNDIVVNNQYVNALVETGLVGVIVFVGFVVLLSCSMYVQSKKASLIGRQSTVLFAVFLGLHAQYLFFSTLTNATYVWLLYGLVLAQILAKKAK